MAIRLKISAAKKGKIYIDPDKITQAKELRDTGCADKAIAQELRMSPQTIYKYLGKRAEYEKSKINY